MPKHDMDRGGGPSIIRRVTLTERAAHEVARRATIVTTRYRKQDADAAASDIIEHLAAGRLLLISEDMRAALPFLETARQQCFSEDAQKGLEQLIAALWSSPTRGGNTPKVEPERT